MIHRRLSSTLLLVVSGACVGLDEPLPPVKQRLLFTPVSSCIEAPQPPPHILGDNAATCIPTHVADGLPLEVTVSKGQVIRFRYYSPCDERTYSVAPVVDQCVRASLQTWGLGYDTACPNATETEPREYTEYYRLMPNVRKEGTANRSARVLFECASE